MDSSLTYWAALDPDRLAIRAVDKVRAWRRWFAASGHAGKALKGWQYANGFNVAGEDSSKLQMGGDGGQLVKTVINGVRPLRQRIVAAVLSGAPDMQPVASNSDAAAREQATLSKGVLEHVHRVHRRRARDKKVLDLAMDMSEGFLVIEWDATQGEPVAVDEEGNPAMWAGDFRYWVASAFDVYRDAGLRDWDDKAWVIARRWVSKYRLAALYPEKAERILRQSTGSQFEDEHDVFSMRMLHDSLTDSDMIAEYVLWHLDTPELPGGREMRFLRDGTWLSDGPYPYDGKMLPVLRLAPDDVGCTSLGYTTIFDALGVSDAINMIASAMTTNLAKGMVPPIIDFESSGLQPGATIGTGHKIVRVSRPELAPKAMEMPSTPPEAYKALDVFERWRLEGVGLNETAIGRPPYSGMAAQAMALLDSKVDQYNEGLQKGVVRFLEDAATFEVRILKRYAHEERIAQIAGKANQWMAKAYNSESLSMVDGFHVEPVGPQAKTLAGKLGLLETFANFGVPLSPEQIVELTRTGQYESDFEAPQANRLRIREENEMLMRGEVPPVLMARPHWQDIPEHLAVIASPAMTERPDVVEAVMATVTAKLELWRSMPPDLLALLGGPPAPPPVPVPGVDPGTGNQFPEPAGTGGTTPPPGAMAPAVEAVAPTEEDAAALPQPPIAA